MTWHMGDGWGWWMVLGWVWMVVFWGLIIWAVYAVVRRLEPRPTDQAPRNEGGQRSISSNGATPAVISMRSNSRRSGND